MAVHGVPEVLYCSSIGTLCASVWFLFEAQYASLEAMLLEDNTPITRHLMGHATIFLCYL